MRVLNKLFNRKHRFAEDIKSDEQYIERIHNLFVFAFMVIVFVLGLISTWNFILGSRISTQLHNGVKYIKNGKIKESIDTEGDEVKPWNPNCSHWDCFNVYRCGQREGSRMNIYVYPVKKYLSPRDHKKTGVILTKEYHQILETVLQSDYNTPNPHDACLFLPSMDMLNENLIDTELFGKSLVSLDHWESGENHLIFNIVPIGELIFNGVLNVGTDKAIIVGGGFDYSNYRYGFDIAFPVWSPLLEKLDISNMFFQAQRKYLLIAAQRYMLPEHRRIIKTLAKNHPTYVLILQVCNKKNNFNQPLEVRCNMLAKYGQHDYPFVFSKGKFCVFARSTKQGQPDFLEMLAFNCIPIVVSDNIVLPFEDVIDWSLATIRIRETDIHNIVEKLRSISDYKILEMQKQCEWLFRNYFKDLTTITLTTLEILNGRIFSHIAKTNLQWNRIDTNYKSAQNPLFQPLISVNSQGFTAVILTYDRVESLFTLIQKLALVSSLQSILIIWNNQRKAPPLLSKFPKIQKPLKVIQTRVNKLSNRFYPYDEIETEAILTIDDDIIMLTADELNFGFEVWREFPDRIVGFPSRIHIWDNTTMHWHYESEWTNQISMVLTGAAFHHKYWNFMYTNSMPIEIRDWVDEHMNCEDIAMNFLVANITNKPPIKVAPRKKFKCPECTNNEMLSAYLNHMMERSTCIDRFAQFYGHMPLRSVEFRADPVLYKDNFPDKLKRFNEIGSL